MSNLKEKVTEALQKLDLVNPEIDVEGDARSIFATVVSGSFANVDEAERQRQVWGSLRENLSDEERVVVEFVLTITPDEREEYQKAV